MKERTLVYLWRQTPEQAACLEDRGRTFFNFLFLASIFAIFNETENDISNILHSVFIRVCVVPAVANLKEYLRPGPYAQSGSSSCDAY
jgi:hypothetical protein